MSNTTAPGVPLAFLCHPYHRGGVTQWMIDAAVEWASRDNPCWFVVPRPTVRFVSGEGRPTILELLHIAAAGTNLVTIAPPVGRSFELGSRRWRAYEYAKALTAGVPAGVAVIVSDDEPVWRAGAWCSQRNPLVGVLHSDDPHYYSLAARYSRRASALVAVSQRIQRRIGSLSSVGGPEIVVIACGVRLGAPRVAASDGRESRILWVGRVDEEQKRASDVVRIAAALHSEGVPFTIDVIGDGPVRVELERMIARNGLASRVRLLGWRSRAEIRSLLEDSNLLVSTSNFEGMPLVVMEALAAGCGVVATRVSGVEDYAGRPGAANSLRTYPIGDVTAATNAIRAMMQLPAGQLARDARSLAEMEFSIERCMDRYAAVVRRSALPRAATPRLWPHRLAAAGSPLLAYARALRAGVEPSVRA
jgi:glycosyltransferase involved in cell wall biosynthesis